MNSKNEVIPHEDYGFFGPDSVVWKVWNYPTALTVGFQRTVVTEMYEPFLLASVHDTEAVMKRPALRYDRTLQYMATIAFHDSRSVLKHPTSSSKSTRRSSGPSRSADCLTTQTIRRRSCGFI